MFSQAELADEKNYYKGSVDHHADEMQETRNWSAGFAVYDISIPGDPKQIGFMPVNGTGLSGPLADSCSATNVWCAWQVYPSMKAM
jgi:hypothetical protein